MVLLAGMLGATVASQVGSCSKPGPTRRETAASRQSGSECMSIASTASLQSASARLPTARIAARGLSLMIAIQLDQSLSTKPVATEANRRASSSGLTSVSPSRPPSSVGTFTEGVCFLSFSRSNMTSALRRSFPQPDQNTCGTRSLRFSTLLSTSSAALTCRAQEWSNHPGRSLPKKLL